MSPTAFTRSGDAATRAAEDEQRLNREVERAAIGQLLAGGPLVDTAHVLGAVLLATLIWNLLPVERTIAWALAIVAAAGVRTWWRLHALRQGLRDERALTGVRLTVLGVAQARTLGDQFAAESAAVTDYVRRARGGKG